MPTYSYRCTECENVFDTFHSMSCKDSQFCPECGKIGVKLLSASSVIFKGSGFYSTDYRDSGYLEAKKKDSSGMSSSSNNNKSSSTTETPSTTDTPTTKTSTDSKPDSSSTAKSDSKAPAASSSNTNTAPIVQPA